MFSNLKKMTSKVMATLLVIIMLTAMIPMGTFISALAVTLDSYTITLTDGMSAIDLDGVAVTLTNKADTSKSSKKTTVNGVATFENFVEEGVTYTVSIAEKTGYEIVSDFEIAPVSVDTNYNVALDAIEEVELRGIIKDENGNPYSGATVEVTGYITDTKVSGSDGSYSFTAYKGKNYAIKATAKEAKYEVASTTINSLSASQPPSELQFAVKQFTITANGDSNGSLTETSTVKYGESKAIIAVANDGYCIDSFKVDGVEQSDATAKKEYTYSFTNITVNHNVNVVFKRQTYKISFTVGENGKVEYTNGSKDTVAGGSVNIEKEFNESEDPSNPTKVTVDAIPNENYRVSEVVVDGVSETFAENDKKVEGVEFTMTQDHTFVVVFNLNQFSVTVNSDENGTAFSDQENVNYNETTKITMIPNDNYNIESVTINGELSTAYTMNNNGGYTLVIENVTNDITVDVSYSKIPSISMDNVSLNTEDARKIDNSDDDVIKYIYAHDSVAVFTTTGDRIRINGSPYSEQKLEIKKSTLIEKIEVYKNRKWSNVELEKSIQIIIDTTAPSITSVSDGICTNESSIEISGAASDDTTESKNLYYFTNNNGWDNVYAYAWYSNSRGEVVENLGKKFPGVQMKYTEDVYSVELSGDMQYVIFSNGSNANQTVDIALNDSENAYYLTGGRKDNKFEVKSYIYNDEDVSSGLSHIVWSKDKELSEDEVIAENINKSAIKADGTFSFKSDEGVQDSVYYIYAVDVSGNVSEAKTVNVLIDTTKPIVTDFEFSLSENSLDVEDLSFLSYGTISSKTIFVTVTTADKGEITSGANEITLYADSEELGTKAVDKNNRATFELTKDKFENGKEISAAVDDKAGNVSKKVSPTDEADGVSTNAKSDIVKIDTAKPTATIVPAGAVYTDADNKLWYNGDLSLDVVTEDTNTGIRSVEIKLNGTLLDNDKNDKNIIDDYSATYTTSEAFIINTAQNAVDGENTIEVSVINNAGVKSETYTQKVYIDTTTPDIANFEIKKVGGSALDKVLNFLTFGVFFNENVEITVTAKDTKASAGVKEITLYADDEELETKTVENDACTFTVLSSSITDKGLYFNKVLSAKAKDNVNNVTAEAVDPTTVNSDIKNSKLMIETVEPTVEVIYPEATNKQNDKTQKSDEEWYNSDVEFTVTTSDVDSGLRNVLITINGKELVNENLYSSEVHSKEYKVNTKDATIKEDGSYTIEVVVTDNAGNVNVENSYSKTIFKDVDKPYITGFDFEPEKYIEGSETDSTVEVTDYGFYFKERTKVTISSRDDDPSAGIQHITYYTVDINNRKTEEKSSRVDENGNIEIFVDENFKGQIYAKATDNVDNVQDEFVNPNSAIVENEDKHNQEEHITFDKGKAVFVADDGEEFYSADVPVTVTVTDTYSGIREIEWEVVSPYDVEKNQNGKVTINNDKSIVEGSDSDWKTTKTDVNLVTKMQKTITVNNNSNDIKVKVKMTDRAGNTTEEEIEFSIDMTKPIIEVTYDNNTPDDEYRDIYKANRTATIKVTERNFNGDDVVYKITNTDDVIPKLSKWETHKNNEDPDKTYYIATIPYTADGDYTFDISYSDLAKNPADKFKQHAFTIDKTVPTLSVAYDNNSVANGNYYKEDRTATITIVEHNFDASRVNVIGTATDDGATLSFPTTSSWTDNGDTHTAIIDYSFDSKFTFDVEFSDKAGNPITDYTVEEFYVDKTPPTLEISGVDDKSANNGIVAPVITYTDTNFNRNAVEIELVGVNNKEVDYVASTENIVNGQKYTYANFEEVQKVDDIYTLTATLTDMAGNETEKSITFSANRFGSVYTFDEYLQEIEGKYTNAEQDVIFTETNVDTIVKDSVQVKLFKDGTPSDLKEGTDYTVTHTGGNGKWSQYRYVVNKSLFANDGKYRLTVLSEDAAGNVNENIEESKKAEISFGIDKTDPVIVPIDFESGKQYPVEVKTVETEIKDNLVLADVKIYLGEEKAENEVKYTVEEETYIFDIPQSNEKQSVIFVATDAAGNIFKLPIEDFLVSTNLFVRWYNNTPLFIGSIVGVSLIAIGIAAFFIFGKKKKSE